MKKIWTVLMVLVLLCASMTWAAAEEKAALTVDEVDAFLELLREEALQDENLIVVAGEEDGVYHATFSGGMLYLAEDALRADTAIVGAELSAERKDLRDLALTVQVSELPSGAMLQDVLAAYPCDNAELYGSFDEAVVAMSGSVPGTAFAGVVSRSGQQVHTVTYYAYETVDGMTVCASVAYRIADQQLLGVHITGPAAAEDAGAEWARLAEIQEETDYFAYPSSQVGSELDMFVREDLSFSGLDFLSLDVETLTDRFGEPTEDTWLEDQDGTLIRTVVWNGMEVTLRYDAGKQLMHATHLVVSTAALEGPRGVRIGDSMTSMLYRFRHGEGEGTNHATVLYGQEGQAPYGELRYEGDGAYLTYLAQVPDGRVSLHLNCEQMYLTSYMLVFERAE